MKKTIIISEAGVNHNGDLSLAKQLIDVAADAKSDYVKFQTFTADELVSKNTEKADYQKAQTQSSESHYEMIKKLELDFESHLELIKYCNKRKIKFLSTPFDIKSIDLLLKLNLDYLKIPSGEITNYPYLKYIASTQKPIIMSSGMATQNEIEMAINTLTDNGLKLNQLSLMHCNTEYPTPFEDVNLFAMKTLKEKFDVPVGYSDHTSGIEVPIAAVALGANIIEKHFTLDRSLPGPDHAASLEPNELKTMIEKIRNIESSLGESVKKPSKSELKNIPIARKSIVAKLNIKKGDSFSKNNITTKRPGLGLSPMEWNNVIGKKAKKDFKADDLVEL
jgi:N,N'-diacetyllegionaminate synthase